MWNYSVGDKVFVLVGETQCAATIVCADEAVVTVKYDDDGSEEVFGQDAPELSKAA